MYSRYRLPRIEAILAGILIAGVPFSWARAQEPSADATALASGRRDYAPCATCHGADGRSTVVPQYPKIGGQNAAYLMNALRAYRDGRRQGTYAALMAPLAKPLSDTQIANLARYIQSLGR